MVAVQRFQRDVSVTRQCFRDVCGDSPVVGVAGVGPTFRRFRSDSPISAPHSAREHWSGFATSRPSGQPDNFN